MKLHTKPEDFHALIQLSAKYKSIPESAIERDYFIVMALQQAKKRLDANVKFDLTMELLLLTIQEN